MPIWVCDSFQGLPPAQDLKRDSDIWQQMAYLRVPVETVKATFDEFGLLDDRVHFVVGFFDTTMYQLAKELPKDAIAVLRLDGDMYTSITDCLYSLYDKLSVGGYLILDDWKIGEAQWALREFRELNDIREPLIITDDHMAVYWIKTRMSDKRLPHYLWYLQYRAQRGLSV